MTNHYHLAASVHSQPIIADRMLRVRGYNQTKRVQAMIEEHGWEYAAERVCAHCECIIENPDAGDHGCGNMRPQHPAAPV